MALIRTTEEHSVSLICRQDGCCGVNGPSDWQKYTSAFRTENNDADYPWPRQCCVMNKLKEPLNVDACKLGVPGYYHSQVSPRRPPLPRPPNTCQEFLLLFVSNILVTVRNHLSVRNSAFFSLSLMLYSPFSNMRMLIKG